MAKFAGKVALVTGAASPRGIGFATARKLAAEGASVLLTDIDGAEIDRSAALIRAAGGHAAAVQHDVGIESEWCAAIELVLKTFGKLDVLVNNAGRALLRALTDHSLEDFDSLLSANLKGVFIGCREAVKVMRRQGHGGAIVNVSSVAGMVGVNSMSIYSATKGGMLVGIPPRSVWFLLVPL
jgi:NAD(P)-dependent dehydrogenase (short-subunit alcohol dehydrogenase family)